MASPSQVLCQLCPKKQINHPRNWRTLWRRPSPARTIIFYGKLCIWYAAHMETQKPQLPGGVASLNLSRRHEQRKEDQRAWRVPGRQAHKKKIIFLFIFFFVHKLNRNFARKIVVVFSEHAEKYAMRDLKGAHTRRGRYTHPTHSLHAHTKD